jgi:hypothetical protein
MYPSAVHRALAADPRPFAIYPIPNDIPLVLESYNYAQIEHGKPLALGFLSRRDAVVERRAQLMREAYESVESLRSVLDEIGPAYVVVHKHLFQHPRQRLALPLLNRRSGLPKVYEDGQTVVYASGIDPAEGPGFPTPRPPPRFKRP